MSVLQLVVSFRNWKIFPWNWQDDEYAVYSTNQQRIRYLVEFTLPDDELTSLPLSDNEGAVDTGDDSDVDINTQEDQSNTIGSLQCFGLT